MRSLHVVEKEEWEGRVDGKPIGFAIRTVGKVELVVERNSRQRFPNPHDYRILYAGNDEVPDGFEFAWLAYPGDPLVAYDGLALYIRCVESRPGDPPPP